MGGEDVKSFVCNQDELPGKIEEIQRDEYQIVSRKPLNGCQWLILAKQDCCTGGDGRTPGC